MGMTLVEGHMAIHIRRRGFIKAIAGSAAAWPLAARAQQPAMPVIGFLHSSAPAALTSLMPAFRKGLSEARLGRGSNPYKSECRGLWRLGSPPNRHAACCICSGLLLARSVSAARDRRRLLSNEQRRGGRSLYEASVTQQSKPLT
jgi:hypothetical protein